MPEFSFLTIGGPSEGLYREKGSKFLAFAYPVTDEAQIKEKLEYLKKKYFDARHHCYAWVLGAEKNRFRAYDDGEPSHSAGDPILGQIRSRNLTNILVVVVRYFGGVKLGTGGLAAAYRQVVAEALNRAVVYKEELRMSYSVQCSYEVLSGLMKILNRFEVEIYRQDYAQTQVNLKVLIPMRKKQAIVQELNQFKSTALKLIAEDK